MLLPAFAADSEAVQIGFSHAYYGAIRHAITVGFVSLMIVGVASKVTPTLNGIPTRKFVVGAFVASGLLTAFAGVLLASKLRIGQASVGLEFLLPALVGAFLGSTTIKPGRVNVWGTIVGVAILAVGIAGIQQFGGSFWVEPLFNGATLLIAIGIAGYAQRKKGAGSK